MLCAGSETHKKKREGDDGGCSSLLGPGRTRLVRQDGKILRGVPDNHLANGVVGQNAWFMECNGGVAMMMSGGLSA